eukprot:6379582-Pyramimonas_sp.AAC.1
MSGLRPHEFSLATTPRQPGMLDRKDWSHLGFLFDMSLGLDATDLVYNMLWAAMVWSLGLGTPWENASYAVPDDSLPPLPHTSGRR